MEGAMEKLFEEGVQQGIELGRPKWIAEGRGEIISRLLNSGKLTLEEISIMLDLPLSEVQSYAKQG